MLPEKNVRQYASRTLALTCELNDKMNKENQVPFLYKGLPEYIQRQVRYFTSSTVYVFIKNVLLVEQTENLTLKDKKCTKIINKPKVYSTKKEDLKTDQARVT